MYGTYGSSGTSCQAGLGTESHKYVASMTSQFIIEQYLEDKQGKRCQTRNWVVVSK